VEVEIKGYDDVKEYIDENLTVLDYFLKPTEIEWQELPLPQPNENANAIINTERQQYGVDGNAKTTRMIFFILFPPIFLFFIKPSYL
jgi:hypothetical protein